MSSSAAQLRAPPRQAYPLAALSRGLVQLFRHSAGRGPTKVRSFWAGDDSLLVLLGGGYTKAEETLWDHGRAHTAVAYRRAVLDALERDMREVVESSLGRNVIAVLSSAHHDPDVMAVVFLLEPLGGRGSAEVGNGAPATRRRPIRP